VGGYERICFGVLFIAIGGIGVVLGIKRRAAHAALFSLAFVALGIGALLRLYPVDRALGAVYVLIGAQVLTEGIRARSAKNILIAIALAAAGVGVLARLFTIGAAFGVFMAVSGGWGLAQAVRMKAVGGMLVYGGIAAMGIGYVFWFIPLMALGPLAVLVGLVPNRWWPPRSADI